MGDHIIYHQNQDAFECRSDAINEDTGMAELPGTVPSKEECMGDFQVAYERDHWLAIMTLLPVRKNYGHSRVKLWSFQSFQGQKMKRILYYGGRHPLANFIKQALFTKRTGFIF